MTFTDQVKALGLPLDQLIVIGSGVLETLGIRNARDIDLVVRPELFERLEATNAWHREVRHGESVLLGDGIEIWTTWADARGALDFTALAPDTIVIDNVRFVSLPFLRQWKAWKGRSQDRDDIERIDAYLNQHD